MEVHGVEPEPPCMSLNFSGGVWTASHESWSLAGKLGMDGRIVSSFEEGDS
jgi:hypothetical protein